tara:strand:+ start:202 stop:360 length:159 start_codon:yes stop_codon:yes gene_type:complete
VELRKNWGIERVIERAGGRSRFGSTLGVFERVAEQGIEWGLDEIKILLRIEC